MMGNKDKISKDILKEIAYDISKYLLNLDIDENIEVIDKELLKIEKREADLLFKTKNRVVQIEIQNNFHPKMHLRMIRYFSDLVYEFEDYEIIQYVIYIGSGNKKFKTEYKNVDAYFKYRFIDMREIDCRLFLNSDEPKKIILSVLCDFKGEDKESIISEILVKLKKYSKDRYEFDKNIAMLEILSTNRGLENIVNKGIKMLSQLSLYDLPTYKEAMELGLKEGEEKGMQKGLLKGKILAYYELGVSIEEISKKLNVSSDIILKILKESK